MDNSGQITRNLVDFVRVCDRIVSDLGPGPRPYPE